MREHSWSQQRAQLLAAAHGLRSASSLPLLDVQSSAALSSTSVSKHAWARFSCLVGVASWLDTEKFAIRLLCRLTHSQI